MLNQEKLFPKVIGDVPYPIDLMTGAAELELLSLFFLNWCSSGHKGVYDECSYEC